MFLIVAESVMEKCSCISFLIRRHIYPYITDARVKLARIRRMYELHAKRAVALAAAANNLLIRPN
jgi:hypothetical protein